MIKQSPRIETVIRARPGRELSGRQKIKLRYQEHLRQGGHDFLGKSKGPSNELELKSPSADESRVDESVRDQLIDVDRPSDIIAIPVKDQELTDIKDQATVIHAETS